MFEEIKRLANVGGSRMKKQRQEHFKKAEETNTREKRALNELIENLQRIAELANN
jgi:hypothetical protein